MDNTETRTALQFLRTCQPPPAVDAEGVSTEEPIEACRRIFGGQEFGCNGDGCKVKIQWLGVCDACLARIEGEEVSDTKSVEDRMETIGFPGGMLYNSWVNWMSLQGVEEEILQLTRDINKLREWRGTPPLVILTGPPGTGKTHLAAAIARSCLEANGYRRTIRFWPEYTFLQAVKASFDGSEDVIAPAMESDLFILDDFGSTLSSDWAMNTIAGFLSHRIDNDKWTIITTNLDQRKISAIDERLASRTNRALIINTRAAKDARKRPVTESQKWMARGSGA